MDKKAPSPANITDYILTQILLEFFVIGFDKSPLRTGKLVRLMWLMLNFIWRNYMLDVILYRTAY